MLLINYRLLLRLDIPKYLVLLICSNIHVTLALVFTAPKNKEILNGKPFCAVIFKGVTASRVRFGTWLLQKIGYEK